MNQLPAWLASGESTTLEFKKSTAEKDRACRTLCAFATGHGLEPPVMTVRAGAVVVTFDVTAARGWPAVLEVDETPGKTPGKTIGKTTGKTVDVVLQLLEKNPHLIVSELAVRAGKSALTIHRAIRKLREEGRLERIGPDKGGHWRVIEDDKEPR